MSLDVDAAIQERFEPHARALLERSADYAALLHAEEVGAEHLLCTLMNDDECAAYRAAMHAFADPATIADEARAMAAGILVSGSAASLPFSVCGVRALRTARASASERGHAAVELSHLLLAAFAELPDDVRARFEDAGWNAAPEQLLAGAPRSTRPVDETGHLFRAFSDDAKRSLSAAARLARQSDAPAISPALLVLAVLQGATDLERASGISSSRARLLLRERTLDPTPPPPRAVAPDEILLTFLRDVPAPADSLALLAHFHAGATPDLARLLARHKVTPALLARVRSAYGDAP